MLRGKGMVRPGRRFVGEDDRGNKYFVTPVDKASRMVASTSHIKEIREVEYPWGNNIDEYVPGTVPWDWQAWLSGQKVDLPTQEETALPSHAADQALGRSADSLLSGASQASEQVSPQATAAPPEPDLEEQPAAKPGSYESWQPGASGRR